MSRKPLDLMEVITPDNLGCIISEKYLTWETFRSNRVSEWKEVLEYVFATDTTKTSNSKLPWSNKTTIPKLCQIRDNLHSNYMAALFPKQKWLKWIGDNEDNESMEKAEAIESFMQWVSDQPEYYNTVSQLVYDFIDYGNTFVMPVWDDETVLNDEREQVGYVGPRARRISPLDIVFDPTANSFEQAPKVIRSIVTLGEVKAILEQDTATDEDRAWAKELYDYMRNIRTLARNHQGNFTVKDRIYDIAGFSSYQAYLVSDSVEVLTFYGDLYDFEKDELLRNHVIKVVDRHKILYKAPSGSSVGLPPIYHAGWRVRQDNLWAMGPLDNLVGMQYRIDHLENMKADCFDLIAYPPLKIKGHVEDFNWGPMERIYIGDDSDVEMMSPDVQVLQADQQIAILEQKMEEMAGSPKEAVGFRTPGEKTKYEVQSLENAASRVFQSKITHFERHITEPLQNGMLDLARSNMTATTVRIIDDEFNIALFRDLTRYDIAGLGRIRPMAARHFAETANMLQNISGFLASPAGMDPEVTQHISSVKLATMWEYLLEAKPFNLIQPYVRLSERTEAQRLQQTQEQQVLTEGQTPSGINGDFDQDVLNEPQSIDPMDEAPIE